MSLDTSTYRDEIVNCLSQQLSEFDLLKSMYPDQGEITLTDKTILNQINHFINNVSECVPGNLDFVLKLIINDIKFDVCICLPSTYPNEEPAICIRCNELSRQQETRMNIELSNYVKENHMGDVCLHTAISWLQDNIDNFNMIHENDVEKEVITTEGKFVRLWVYSHHIYNKKKRDDIVKKAKELNLTGFCLPGKPGVICVEGSDIACNEWWKEIKSLSWKRIEIRKTETFEFSEKDKERKLPHFKEIIFNDVNKHNKMKGFSKYLSELGLSDIFNEFFGLLQ